MTGRHKNLPFMRKKGKTRCWHLYLLLLPHFIHSYRADWKYVWDWNIMHILMNQLLNYSITVVTRFCPLFAVGFNSTGSPLVGESERSQTKPSRSSGTVEQHRKVVPIVISNKTTNPGLLRIFHWENLVRVALGFSPPKLRTNTGNAFRLTISNSGYE